MKLAFALLLLGTTLGTTFGTTLGTGMAALAGGQRLSVSPDAALYPVAKPGAVLTLIDADKVDDDDKGGWFWPKSDDEDDDDDCDEKKNDKGDCAAGTNSTAAKAGPVAPPQNGLFTNGTAPVVKTN